MSPFSAHGVLTNMEIDCVVFMIIFDEKKLNSMSTHFVLCTQLVCSHVMELF